MNRRRSPVSLILALPAVAACLLDEPGAELGAGAAQAALEACPWTLSVAVTPAEIPPTPVGTPVVLDVAVTNPNPAACDPLVFRMNIFDTGLLIDPRPPGPGNPPQLRTIASGETSHLTVTATAPASADGGETLRLNVALSQPPSGPPGPPPPDGPAPPPPQVISPPILFPVAAQPGCQVSARRALMITHLSVVDDPVRTAFDPDSCDPRNGVWTFKHLAEQMARTPRDAPRMVEEMLASFTTPRTINGFTVEARPGMQSQILDAWPRTPDGKLDLARAPLKLQAIVSRVDLRDLARGDAGEGRFVFAFDLPQPPPGPVIAPPQATIILEYKLPAARERDVVRWARAFHELGELPFGEDYNAALQKITERFTRRGARPSHPNGSAINAVRTNEIPFGDNALWELREFRLSRSTGRLEPVPLEMTPDLGFNHTDTLAAYIQANRSQILTATHVVPRFFQGQRFQAGAVFNDLDTWFAPGVDGVDDEARHHFAINTCNGCHAGRETGTGFLHLVPRPPGLEAPRSRWLTGTFVDDPVTGAPRAFDDLGRRKADLASIVCPDEATLSPAQLRKGTSRVH